MSQFCLRSGQRRCRRKAKKVLDKERIEELGDQMEQLADRLRERGEPRRAVPGQTDSPAHI